MITRCYLEITNVCNLDCVFCPKTRRTKHKLTMGEFETLTDKLRGHVRFLYFHLMGEPFLHPHLSQFIYVAKEKGFVPVLTTNGTLLSDAEDVIAAHPHKIQISLHSHEGNGKESPETYIEEVMNFALKASNQGIIIILRLWNEGGYDSANEQILQLIARFLPHPWTKRNDGWKLTDNLYIEFDKMFEWPDESRDFYTDNNIFCYALRNQIGVLVDGSVVPCCLDHEGDMALGNLFEQSFEEILSSTRACSIYDGFTNHKAVESMCQRCGYAVLTKCFRQ